MAESMLSVFQTLDNFFKHLNDTDSDSSSSDEENSGKILLFAEEIVPSYNNVLFKSHFRLNIDSFNCLCKLIHISNIEDVHPGHPQLPLEKQMMITLWFFGNREPFRTLGNRFNCSRATAWSTINKISKKLLKLNIDKGIIKWPNATERRSIQNYYAQKHRFTGIIGAIDGTHIPIIAPHDQPNSYINRKGFHSILLQAVCDHRMKFTHFYAGEVGSIHDARVLRRSGLPNQIESGLSEIHDDEHILGDSAYPLKKWLLTPYKNNGHLTDADKIYNSVHSKCRVVIERAFGMLKGRFRRLKYIESQKTELIPLYIGACSILHNFCIENETTDDMIDIGDDNSEDDHQHQDCDDSGGEEDYSLSNAQRK